MPEENNHSENKDLPSIEEVSGQSDLPSLDEVSGQSELPSVDDVVEKEEKIEEEILDDAAGNPKIEVVDLIKAPEWGELVRMVNDVRKDIPEIPEIKNYDKELEAVCELIDQVKESIPIVPEVRYYEEELKVLEETLESVKESIPTLPKWIEGVNEVPDFNWIGKTFNIIDEKFRIVKDSLETVQEQISVELSNIHERADVENFETKEDLKSIHGRVGNLKDEVFDQLKEQSQLVWNLQKKLKNNQKEFEIVISEKVESLVDEHRDESLETTKRLENQFKKFGNRLDEEIKSLETKVSKVPKPKYYEEELQSIKNELRNFSSLRDVVEEIKAKQGDVAQLLEEGLLNEPPDEEQSLGPVNGPDPLTPLDQRFATLRDLQQHYRLFVNRVQQQLSTLGGGGAVWLRELDDVGIGTQISNGTLVDGYVLKWDANQELWLGAEGGGVGAAGTWTANSVGVSTTKNVGIGTTSALSDYQLYVGGDMHASGNISAAGTVTYEDVTNLDVIGLGTFRSDLLVQGNARIVGVLTAGSSSITIDGDNNEISVGVVTITNTTIILGSDVTIDSSASGINSAPNVFYVAKDGDDDNNGTSIDNAKLTIKAAVGIATTGSVIKVLAGNYTEANPIEVPAFVTITGDDQRSVKVSPSTTNDDIFHVRKGSKLANMTFRDHVAPAAAVGFPTGNQIAENVDGGKWKGPYIQNCLSDTTTGVGIRVDGDQARSLKAMNVDAFTQYNEGGVGVPLLNTMRVVLALLLLMVDLLN